MADGPAERRSFSRCELDARRGRWLSQHHRARWRRAWVAHRAGIHRPRVERSEARRPGLCLRAGDETPAAANVRTNVGDSLSRVAALLGEAQGAEELIDARVPGCNGLRRANELQVVR